MSRATILPFLGVSPPKFQKTCPGYWGCLVPNFMPNTEVLAEKTVTEQKNEKETINLVSSHTPYGGLTIFTNVNSQKLANKS